MEAGSLQFDPSEFEVLETIDFEEEIARPESLRFFTLEEQLSDYFDKVLPKKKVITKFEYKQIATEVDRLRDIYRDIITVTDTDYIVDLTRKEINVPWVKPIYSEFELSSYSYAENWIPLFQPPLRTTANYYPRMLVALPKPYKTVGEGNPILKDVTVVNEEGTAEVNGLGIYERTKGVTHEDGTFTVVKIPITNTADDIKTRGFYIESRPDEIPNPLADHPFLGSNKAGKVITDEDLLSVFPTVEAIMNHGVPRTEYPYSEGMKFLKIYDVKLNQIPWNVWKDRFPAAGTISATPPIMSIAFPKGEDETAPSKTLQDVYSIPWKVGIEPRHWLSTQEDRGDLVVKMLLSMSSKAGLLPPAILNEKPEVQLTSSTPEECLVLTDFDSFLNSGVYRKGYCIPTTYILQEKIEMLAAGKIAWTETTEVDILTKHQTMLKTLQAIETKPAVTKYEKYAGRPPSELRRLILAVMADTERLPEDKFAGIETLLRGTQLKGELYLDDSDSFLICGHTLAILKGDMEDDDKEFFLKWTAVEEGYRTCTYCSERVSANVFAAVDDFDEDGNPIISHDVLSSGPTFIGDTHVVSFSNSLGQLRSAFNLDNAGESIMYLLLSLLQILPTESQLLPILQNLREITMVLKSKKTIAKEDKERTEGILGLAGMVVILLTHNPFLIPRRSFGSKILKLAGFPRDTDDEKDAPVLDIIISVLKTTFESTPGSFKGPVTAVLRKIISKPKEVRKEAITFIKQTRKKFDTQFLSAKERYISPAETEIVGQISLPVLRIDKTDYSITERIGSEENLGQCSIPIPKTYLAGKLPPNVTQQSVTLTSAGVSRHAIPIQKITEKVVSVTVDDKELRRRIGLGFPKGFDKLNSFLKSDADGIACLGLLNRILDILSREKYPAKKVTEYRAVSVFLDTKVSPSILRDQVRGYIYQLFQDVSKDKGYSDAISQAIQRDLTLNMILITKEEATRQDSELRTREREVFKQRMRQMDDSQREVTKMMLDIGIAPYIITNEDRELFKKEYGYADPEAEYDKIVGEEDINRPEDGEGPDDLDGERQIDTGAYGDEREELYDRGEYNTGNFDNEEGYGV